MYLQHSPPQQPDRTIAIGQVDIHPTAAIAPGVILRAAPESRIAISAGACIGMGAILHAYQGEIVVGEGATLGAGVLVVGRAQIGASACIGPATTIFQTDVDSSCAIAPGSILGDPSRKVVASEDEEVVTIEGKEEPAIASASDPTSDEKGAAAFSSTSENTSDSQQPSPPEKPKKAPEPQARKPSILYGRAHVSQLLVTLFPHQHPPQDNLQKGERSQEKSSSESDSESMSE